ncbi:MAG: TIGR01777 family protein [Bdellovibrio sp. CG10_big_fil_rev_8_21_14_0_10_47_8]|nr:MAG: TIGR01777 family protein [Bdellovibrio sp. CG10_big_fil_rev_8_21_14_0_10_47_8]
MKILMTGATGLIGKELGKKLIQKGHQIFVISRNQEKAQRTLPFPCQVIEGDLSAGKIENANLAQIEAVFHLAGENIGDGRWTSAKKTRIRNSRVQLTKNLIQSLEQSARLKLVVSASATGYYGDQANTELTEQSDAGGDFLAKVCVDWEKAVLESPGLRSDVRRVVIRTGVVLAPFGGALDKMKPIFQTGLGGALGSGEQWMSWVHLEDLIQIYSLTLDHREMNGVYNAVAPEVCTNREFSQKLAQSLGSRMGPAVPAWVLKIVLGEMAAVVLSSQRASCGKIQKLGFQFQFSGLEEALKNCCQHLTDGDQAFYAEQFVQRPKSEVFPFFSEAKNLQKITPEELHFNVIRSSTAAIEEGTLIDYRLKIHGVPVSWRTRIETWNPPDHFVDTQLKGPYAKWHHTHSFVDMGGGTLMSDLVRYRMPLGCLGRLAAGPFVRKDISKIFAYRQQVVEKIFPSSRS